MKLFAAVMPLFVVGISMVHYHLETIVPQIELIPQRFLFKIKKDKTCSRESGWRGSDGFAG